MSDFEIAVNLVLDHEGVYSDHEKDNGGKTKYGISSKSFPKLDIQEITKEQAQQIYRENYWNKIRGDYLPLRIGLVLFDMAVNLGVKRSIQILQKTVAVKQDGIFGPVTMRHVEELNSSYIVEVLTTERLRYYSELEGWEYFKNGWIQRSVETLTTAMMV